MDPRLPTPADREGGMNSDWFSPPVCAICGGRKKWCRRLRDGSLVMCMRVAAGSVSQSKNGGWIHRLHGCRSEYCDSQTIYIESRQPREDITALADAYERAAWPMMKDVLAANLGLTLQSLERLNLGWAYDLCSSRDNMGVFDAGDAMRLCSDRCWAFPMRDGAGSVIGIRLRNKGGKFAISGSRAGVFIPTNMPSDGRLFICEGPTDTAAMLDLGFAAIGRDCCTGGTSLIVDYLRRHKFTDVVVLSDADAPGRRGAMSLGSTLRLYAKLVRTIEPPEGIKDARAWVNAGAAAADVLNVVHAVDSPGWVFSIEMPERRAVEHV
jgi:hypothetical protein